MKTIRFETVSRYNKVNCPVTASIPFSEGKLREDDIKEYFITDNSNTYPYQYKVTSSYSDGSVRFLLLRFLAQFDANQPKAFSFGKEEKENHASFTPIEIKRKTDGSLEIKSSRLSLSLGAPGETLIKEFSDQDKAIASTEGPFISNGIEEFEAFTGIDGWRCEEEGPLYSVLSTSGKHIAKDKT